MFKKIFALFWEKIIIPVTNPFIICPYINNEAKYMAKGVKAFSVIADSEDFLEKYEYPLFNRLVKEGIVLETKEQKKIQHHLGHMVDFTYAYYYYPNEEWRIKKWKDMQKVWLKKYPNSWIIREGILLGYPKKYIKRYMVRLSIANILRTFKIMY